jgi:hypothetical protein
MYDSNRCRFRYSVVLFTTMQFLLEIVEVVLKVDCDLVEVATDILFVCLLYVQ